MKSAEYLIKFQFWFTNASATEKTEILIKQRLLDFFKDSMEFHLIYVTFFQKLVDRFGSEN